LAVAFVLGTVLLIVIAEKLQAPDHPSRNARGKASHAHDGDTHVIEIRFVF
jgi:hypothetical protein